MSRHLLYAAIVLSALLVLPENGAVYSQDRNGPISDTSIFATENLVAWCIVPFDDRHRSPEDRAAMLEGLGITRLAYDYRAKHVPEFEQEIQALKDRGIELTAWWFPGTLSDQAKHILDVLRKHNVTTQLWVSGGGSPTHSEDEYRERVAAEVARIRPIAEAAAEIGCHVSLYNHGGWFGEPANQLAVIRELKMDNVGIVYNFHHAHHQVDQLRELLEAMMPHLDAVNLNGMTSDGDKSGKKILPVGEGELDVALLRVLGESGYKGPIGILNHTQEDAEARLRDNIDGLKWVASQIRGEKGTEKPTWRSYRTSE